MSEVVSQESYEKLKNKYDRMAYETAFWDRLAREAIRTMNYPCVAKTISSERHRIFQKFKNALCNRLGVVPDTNLYFYHFNLSGTIVTSKFLKPSDIKLGQTYFFNLVPFFGTIENWKGILIHRLEVNTERIPDLEIVTKGLTFKTRDDVQAIFGTPVLCDEDIKKWVHKYEIDDFSLTEALNQYLEEKGFALNSSKKHKNDFTF